MKRKNKLTQDMLWQIFGVILIWIAVLLTLYNNWEEQRAEDMSIDNLERMSFGTPITGEETGEMVIPDYVLNPDMEMPTETIDNYKYIGKIEIPSLNISLPVINEWSYKALKIAPCRYAGSAYKDNMIIAAHNYEKHFGEIKTLTQGEKISFSDIDGNVFNYTVSEVEILGPTEIDKMVLGKWDLTLFTCTKGGASRVTVRCSKDR